MSDFSKTVVAFDPSTAIRDKVREMLLETLTDEQLDAFIKAEFGYYFEEGPRKATPRFKLIVREEIETLMKARVTAWLDKNFQSEWKSGDAQRLVGKMVAELIPIVQQQMTASMIEVALRELADRLGRQY